jgi:hypothetical protein
MTSSEPGIGDLGCTQIRGDVGWLIKLGERLNGDKFAQYQHAFVYIGGGQLVEAEPGGARIADLSEYDARTIVWVRCPDEHRLEVAAAAKNLVGVPYGFLDYLALALHHFHIPFPGLKRFAMSSRSLICSQLAVLAARRGGWDVLEPTPAAYVTPAELAALAEPPA